MDTDVDITERIGACRSMTVKDIAGAFGDTEQDEVTRVLAGLIADRTNLSRLPRLPYAVGLTLYGDEDVSEWMIRYDNRGYRVTADEKGDLETRWEHWEDAIRLLNGDISALSLYYARRITIGDEPTGENEPPWFRAVDFAPGTPVLARNRILTDLMIAAETDQTSLARYVEHTGLQAIVEARTTMVATALVEAGCAEELKGTSMAVAVADVPEMCAVAVFDDAGDAGVACASDDGNSADDLLADVTLRYTSTAALLDGATGRRSFQDLLVNGLVKVEGEDASRERFARSLMSFARLHGI